MLARRPNDLTLSKQSKRVSQAWFADVCLARQHPPRSTGGGISPRDQDELVPSGTGARPPRESEIRGTTDQHSSWQPLETDRRRPGKPRAVPRTPRRAVKGDRQETWAGADSVGGRGPGMFSRVPCCLGMHCGTSTDHVVPVLAPSRAQIGLIIRPFKGATVTFKCIRVQVGGSWPARKEHLVERRLPPPPPTPAWRVRSPRGFGSRIGWV